MSIEDGGPLKLYIEPASEADDELCAECDDLCWERLVAYYLNGSCWVLYCGACGVILQKKWKLK